jgi:hypothetical protein
MILDDTATGLYSKLAAGTALTALLSAGTASIYGDAPEDHAAYDYVLFTHAGGGAENINPSALENNVWLVQSFTTTSAKRAAQIAGQVDALLHKQQLTIGTRVNFWTARETNVKLTEVDPAGTRIFRAGGYYRIRSTGT